MTSEEMNEIELFHHANRCLEFFNNYKQDNCFPEGYLGARYLFKFPNSLVLSYVAEDEVYLYSSDNSLELNLPKEQWAFKKETGAWLSKENFTPDYLYDVVSGFTQNFGKSTLIFPWSEWIHRYGPLSDEWADFREERDPDKDVEELDTFTKSQKSQKVIQEISASDPKYFIFHVDHLFDSGDALIPTGSQYSRYRQYCKELENRGWVIIDYMTDQGFAYDRLEEEREESNFDGVAPALVSPLESTFQAYTPSGLLDDWFAIIDLGDGNIEDLQCAEKFGIKIEISKELITILPEK
jgi:hypothetical protein